MKVEKNHMFLGDLEEIVFSLVLNICSHVINLLLEYYPACYAIRALILEAVILVFFCSTVICLCLIDASY